MAHLPTPEELSTSGDEYAHQVALFAWAALNVKTYPELALLFAIPNGGLRDKITAARLKAAGVRAGVPDTFLPVPRGPWHGLFIELKKPGEHRVDPKQDNFINELIKQGFGAAVCVGWEAASKMLIQYLTYVV